MANFPTSIRISRELKTWLKRDAEKRGWKLAQNIQYILDKYRQWTDKREKAK